MLLLRQQYAPVLCCSGLLFSLLIPALVVPIVSALAPSLNTKIVVFGGTGYVGSRVCERLINKGYSVTGVSRRGKNPQRSATALDKVNWVSGDATDPVDVQRFVSEADGVVHAVGLLFDVESGLQRFNTIVSGSNSLPDPDRSTYDNVTRKTMFNIVDAIEQKQQSTTSPTTIPLMFVSAAEAGWTDVTFGDTVEKVAPEWLKKYLAAKRAVESRVTESRAVRSAIFRPSLIWSWDKIDVLPVIPIFNAASAVGIPFVDKTVRVETIADAIVAAIEDDAVSGIQRFAEMEQLAKATNSK